MGFVFAADEHQLYFQEFLGNSYEVEMIKEFVEVFDKNRDVLKAEFSQRETMPSSYNSLVKRVVKILAESDYYPNPNPDKIHIIDDGHYQGTRVFLIPADQYQPSTYFVCKISYGSCSYCDTFQNIMEGFSFYGDDPPSEEIVSQLMNLALHVVQQMKEI
jgi:hypothetical protein